jgi:hypothetical protein
MDNPLEMMCEEKHIYAVSGDHAVVHNKLLTPPLKGQKVAHQYTPNVSIWGCSCNGSMSPPFCYCPSMGLPNHEALCFCGGVQHLVVSGPDRW